MPDDFVRFAEPWEQIGLTIDFGKLQDPPQVVPADLKTFFQAEMAKATPAVAVHPDWLSALCFHRDEFAGTGFFSPSTSPAADVVYKFILAIASLYKAVFVECVRCPATPMAFELQVCLSPRTAQGEHGRHDGVPGDALGR